LTLPVTGVYCFMLLRLHAVNLLILSLPRFIVPLIFNFFYFLSIPGRRSS
jgi:hypothetical protein